MILLVFPGRHKVFYFSGFTRMWLLIHQTIKVWWPLDYYFQSFSLSWLALWCQLGSFQLYLTSWRALVYFIFFPFFRCCFCLLKTVLKCWMSFSLTFLVILLLFLYSHSLPNIFVYFVKLTFKLFMFQVKRGNPNLQFILHHSFKIKMKIKLMSIIKAVGYQSKPDIHNSRRDFF